MKPGVFEKSNIKKTVAILICVMLAVAFRLPLTVHAQESDKTVRVGWYESPFNLTDEFGRRSGYAYEYQQKIAAYTGWNYEYVEGSWPDLFQMLIDGEIDLMSDVSYTDERSELMLFSELPMGAEDYFVFVAPSSESGINSEDLSSFNGKRIGINKGGHDLFWKAVESSDTDAKAMLLDVLQKNTTGDPEKLVNGYLSHIRRFRLFLASEGTAEAKKETQSTAVKPAAPAQYRRKSDIVVPTPSKEQVEYYLAKWDELENYHLQEDALDKLFFKLCPKNTEIIDILLKVSTLNDFYSTNIFSVYPVAKHILSLGIDARLKAGDVTLVNDIKQITINGTEWNFYSFASKYCSHHNSLDYPIYDSYVDVVLRYFRNRDGFASFADGDLKNYVHFKGTLIDFRAFYGLEEYNLKLLDKYLWLLGKKYFPKNYGKKG